jgi:hypothetical protein
MQAINEVTGSMHAAAWVSSAGEVLTVREDLGRHNALDKLIGALMQKNMPTSNGAVIMTSRASYDLAQKTARARIPMLAAILAPTSLAIELVQKNKLIRGLPGNHAVIDGAVAQIAARGNVAGPLRSTDKGPIARVRARVRFIAIFAQKISSVELISTRSYVRSTSTIVMFAPRIIFSAIW